MRMALARFRQRPPAIKYDTIQFHGGFDQITPTLDLPPGVCRDPLNFECNLTGGYTRIAGYERFDGRAKPSAATYTTVQVVSFTNVPVVGNTITGQTTATTGTVVAIGSNFLILTLIVGAGFSNSEEIRVGATIIGNTTTSMVLHSALANAVYLNGAADVYRGLISLPTGSGPLRCVFGMLNSGVHEVFAFRDNAGATAVDVWKKSASGWSAVTLFREVSFTAGLHATLVALDGDIVTQGADTATIKRVMLQSGTFAAGTAAGRLIITTPSPTPFAAGAATIGAITLTLSGADTAITILPGGTYELDKGNFVGLTSTIRMYGCDRVNRCFEFDGVTYAPIKTSLTVDVPEHLVVHQNHLIVSQGSSSMNSGLFTPYNWTALAGAAITPLGDTIVGYKVQPGSQDAPACLVLMRNTTKMLYGTDAVSGSANLFRYVNYNTETGGYAYSAINLDKTYWLDDRGVLSIQTAQEFGNFAAASYTYNIHPYIQEKRSLITTSCPNKDKSQYRIFFSDGSALYLSFFNGKYIGAMPMRFPNPIQFAWNGEDGSGNEVTYLGATNGYVYQLDKGSSFDGTAIESYCPLNWIAPTSHRHKVAFKRAALEIQSTQYASVDFEYALGYGSDQYASQPPRAYESAFHGSAAWDSGIFWDAFVWDGSTLGPSELEMSGSAENVQLRFGSNVDYLYPFTLNSLTIHYLERRALR